MRVINTAMDLLMTALRELPAEIALAIYAVLTGIVILLLFKISSNPARIAAARNKALARVLELWIYREDAVGGLFSVARAMGGSLGYLGTMLKPAAVSIIPMLVMLVQANAWFGFRPLQQGESALVSVQTEKAETLDTLVLASGDKLKVEAMVAVPESNEKIWRVRVAEERGKGRLRLTDGQSVSEKSVVTGSGLSRVSLLRTASRWERILYPDEPLLSQGLQQIKISYRPARYNFAGLELSWLAYLLIISLATGLALKKPMGVEF